MELLKIANWRGSYQGIPLEHLSFSIQEGEAVALVGEQGKSQVIRGILALEKQDIGELYWKKVRVQEGEPRDLLWEVAVVLGDSFLPSGYTCQEIAGILGEIYPTWSKSAYQQYISQLNLPQHRPLLARQERYLCAVAVALARKPSLLLLDPPFALVKEEETSPWHRCLSQCFSLVSRESCSKLVTAPKIELLSWGNWSQVISMERGQSYHET